jgi:hypothetical protein
LFILLILTLLLLEMSFATITLANLKAMGILYGDYSHALQLGQPREEVFPATGSQTCKRIVKETIRHFRISPVDSIPFIQCTHLAPGTFVTVILDPRYPEWAYIQVSGGPRGWVGIHHFSSASAPTPSRAHVAHSFSFSAVALVPITCTYTTPFFQSSQVGCNVPRGSILIVIAVSSCGQWFQLHGSNTWIPASWVQ